MGCRASSRVRISPFPPEQKSSIKSSTYGASEVNKTLVCRPPKAANLQQFSVFCIGQCPRFVPVCLHYSVALLTDVPVLSRPRAALVFLHLSRLTKNSLAHVRQRGINRGRFLRQETKNVVALQLPFVKTHLLPRQKMQRTQ